MDPADFLAVADRLRGSPSEAERRTSVGRAYYALYNLLVMRLSSQGFSFQKDGGDHGRLVRYLIQSENLEASKLGERLKKLRTLRNVADYEMEAAIDANRAELAYRWARTATDLINKISP